MGNQTPSKEPVSLIDVFYQDTARLTSFYAQLFQGNLLSITKAEQASTESGTSFDAGVPIVRGGTSARAETTTTISEAIEPHDQRILSVLEELGLDVETGPLASIAEGRLVLLEGEIIVRNYSAIKDLFPSLIDSDVLDTTIPGNWGAQAAKMNKKQQKQTWKTLFGILPAGLELEVRTPAGEAAIGPLKPGCLADNPYDLLRICGSFVPGVWRVLGVVDQPRKARTPLGTEFRQLADSFAEAIRTMYASSASLAISPILIYRIVESV